MAMKLVPESSLLSALLSSDRMWAPKVSRRSWGLTVVVHGDLVSCVKGVLLAVQQQTHLQSSQACKDFEKGILKDLLRIRTSV